MLQNSKMKNPVQTFEPNELGRDFVIGDLHGSLSCFQNLIKNLNFDPMKDRMFSVGDLVDRGPDSLGCLELLHKPWFHSVLSNHEQMMLEAFYGGPMGEYWTRNGGRWGMAAKRDWDAQKVNHGYGELITHALEPGSQRVFGALPLVREMPYLITVKMADNRKFHIIHAELPPVAGITDEVLEDPESVLKLATSESGEGDFFLWGRYMFRNFYRADMTNAAKIKRSIAYHFRENFGWFSDGLSHIISGHTIVQRPITIIGQTNIDTGAYGSYLHGAPRYESLTCVELAAWKFYQATETEFRTVEPFSVNRSEVLKLRPEFAANPAFGAE